MCQSLAAGGRRCAAHTRPAYEAALGAVAAAQGIGAVMQAQVAAMDAVAAHAATPTGAREVAERRATAERSGDIVTADFLRSCENLARTQEEVRVSVAAQVAATQASESMTSTVASPNDWDPGTPSLDAGPHWSIAEGGDRWQSGGCGAFAIAMVERWPHLKIACEMYSDHGSDSVAHAWAYDPAENRRFHIFGAEEWTPTTRPDYDPDSHTVLLDQTPEDVRRLFRGNNTSEETVFDAMEVACEMFDPGYQPPDDEFNRDHLYFW